MSHSMERKRWLRRQGMCTQCGTAKASGWRCAQCREKQKAHARARMTQASVPQSGTQDLNACLG